MRLPRPAPRLARLRSSHAACGSKVSTASQSHTGVSRPSLSRQTGAPSTVAAFRGGPGA